MNTIKDMVKNKVVTFLFYKEGELWYTTECGFEFPVPISDTGTAAMNRTDKAILFMRWIRKHVIVINEYAKQREDHQKRLETEIESYENTGGGC